MTLVRDYVAGKKKGTLLDGWIICAVDVVFTLLD